LPDLPLPSLPVSGLSHPGNPIQIMNPKEGRLLWRNYN